MKLLEAYILKRVWTMFLTALLPVLAIIWTTQVLNRINLVTDSGQSIGSFMKLASLILPTLLPAVMPFALVIGITQTLTVMNNDSELAVIDAAGASRSIIFRPLIGLAIALSIFSFVMSSFVEPKLRVSVREMIAAAYADLLSTVIEEKTFRKLDDGLYVQISQRLSGRILKGLFVADSRDPAYDMIYYAREGAVDESGKALIMRDGEVERKTPEGNVSIVRFDSYSFDLSELSQSRGEARLRANDRDLFYLLAPDVNDKDYQKNAGEYRSELHARLTGWLSPLAFALISLVVAGDARSHREARLHPMVSALTMAIGLYWLSNYSVNLVERDAAYIPFVYAVPLGTIGLCGVILARGRGLRLPAPIERLIAQLSQLARRRLNRLGGSGGTA